MDETYPNLLHASEPVPFLFLKDEACVVHTGLVVATDGTTTAGAPPYRRCPARSADVMVLNISMVTVIGPTPPGTGVM